MEGRTGVIAVLFDIDDTLSDWGAAIDAALVKVARLLPRRARGGAADAFREIVERTLVTRRDGIVVDRSYWRLLYEPGPPWRETLTGESAATVARVADAFRAAIRPVAFADAAPAIEALRGRFPLGILTNSPAGEESLTALGLRDHFTAVVSADESHRKPDRIAFERACAALEAPAAQVALVGDSIRADIEGAVAAGLVPIWLDRLSQAGATPPGVYKVTSLAQLPSLLESLAG